MTEVRQEPSITLNGTHLTTGQAMTVRVALQAFGALLSEPYPLGRDERNLALTELYRDRLREIVQLLQT
ncbi:hypothetical protein IHE31_00130 (plasmid) [Mycetohabitans rhizoxinica]|uniref:hypothetical protein n=1 Tax=Mycetohabitans rhizoxinica TaxID=412963 RepID=UPI0030D29796